VMKRKNTRKIHLTNSDTGFCKLSIGELEGQPNNSLSKKIIHSADPKSM
jgi:hypothetical protein